MTRDPDAPTRLELLRDEADVRTSAETEGRLRAECESGKCWCVLDGQAPGCWWAA